MATHALREVLDGVDRLAVAADEQAEVLARQLAADQLAVVVDGDLRVEAERVDDLLEQLAERVRGRRASPSAPPSRALLLLARRARGRAAASRLLTAARGGRRLARALLACHRHPLRGSAAVLLRRLPAGVRSAAAASGGWCAMCSSMMYCWPTVQRFVVIQ